MRLLAILALALSLAACGESRTETTVESEPERAVVTAERTGARFVVEVADTGAERADGLMGRTSLPADGGMLFLYDAPSSGGYWMKDTLIPLSIAFLGESGRVLAILDMTPCRADPCHVYDPGVVYRAALEVKSGAFARAGIRKGDVLRISR